MAEEFIEEIYNKGIIIEQLREYIAFSNKENDRDARAAYNQAASGLEKELSILRQTDRELAEAIENAAVMIRDRFDDPSEAKAIAEGELLPLMFHYMLNYSGIEVTEGKYTIQSANSGFLTIRDNELNKTIHNSFDPLWEAYEIAEAVFDPEVECYHILGCGLGYIPYQLWRKSEGAVKIIIYEEDSAIIDYAKRFGVLGWIPEKSLTIQHDSRTETVAGIFLEETSVIEASKKKNSVYFSSWKKDIYKAVCNGEIAVLEANITLDRSMRDRTAINLWKNKKHDQISFDKIQTELRYDEWIVVSAGPSLDDQIIFLKESKGRRGIVAVNTVLRRLLKEEIYPDLIAAADQYVQMREHIDGIGDRTRDIPLIAEKRLNWQYSEQYQGPICFVSTEQEYADNAEEVWQISGSVAGLALESAIRLGAKKVYLVGQDLAYPDGKTYAEGMPYHADASSRGTMLVPSVDGGMVPTSEAFNWFRMGLEAQIAKYSLVEYHNLSRHGALIRGCKTNS